MHCHFSFKIFLKKKLSGSKIINLILQPIENSKHYTQKPDIGNKSYKKQKKLFKKSTRFDIFVNYQ